MPLQGESPGNDQLKASFRLGTKPSRRARTLPPLVAIQLAIQSIYFSRMRCEHEADGKEVKVSIFCKLNFFWPSIYCQCSFFLAFDH